MAVGKSERRRPGLRFSSTTYFVAPFSREEAAFASGQATPLRDFGRLLEHFRQHLVGLHHVRGLEVGRQSLFAAPVFVEQELAWAVRRFVQVVIDAAGLGARGAKQRKQNLANAFFLAAPGA